MVHTKEEYDKFDKTLDMYFNKWNQEMDIKNKSELKILMDRQGFRIKRIDGVSQFVETHPKQVKYAWDRFQSTYKQLELSDISYYIETEYGNRLTKNEMVINGKRYRKGQFIPKNK